MKIIDEIIIPYLEHEKENSGLPKEQSSFLIMDVFRGQTTQAMLKKLKKNYILVTKVPQNMTHIFQPLDLSVDIGPPNEDVLVQNVCI